MSVGHGPLGEVTCVRGESFAISGTTGDIAPHGDQGYYVRDTRFLDHLELRIDGAPPSPLSSGQLDGGTAVFHAHLPPQPSAGPDSTVLVTRHRVIAGGLHDDVELSNGGHEAVEVRVEVRLGTDFAYIFDVKHGRHLPPVSPTAVPGGLEWRRPGGVECITVRSDLLQPDGDRLTGTLLLPPASTVRCCLRADVQDVYGETTADPTCRDRTHPTPAWLVGDPDDDAVSGRWPRFTSSEPRFTRLVRRSVSDLRSLEVRDPDHGEDRFVTAGSPWYLTLFGRDSLWSALMALPLDLDLAGGTLRALARRQGQQVDLETEEAPGKILHEVRRGALAARGDLPPNYYGSVDATPLFVILAHEAWCWGLPDEQVRDLIPHVEAALGWLRDHGDADGDGFLEYVQHGRRGLVNQGWKDSVDGIRFADGTLARAPIALSEVQGYAYAAALRGAELLDRFDRPGGPAFRAWADALRIRFRDGFWVEDAQGAYPAVALDHDKRPVDGVASNMGHLLFTGILDRDEAALVAARLTTPDMASGFGLRTLSADNGGYNPLSYHCGSVWPHDTAIAAWGLGRTGHARAAGQLIEGLLLASPLFAFRLPELLSGVGTDRSPVPVPYPSSCRPQAWAAGAALLAVRTVFGLDAKLPDGTLTLDPPMPPPVSRLAVRDLPLAGGRLHVELDVDRVTASTEGLDGIEVVVRTP